MAGTTSIGSGSGKKRESITAGSSGSRDGLDSGAMSSSDSVGLDVGATSRGSGVGLGAMTELIEGTVLGRRQGCEDTHRDLAGHHCSYLTKFNSCASGKR